MPVNITGREAISETEHIGCCNARQRHAAEGTDAVQCPGWIECITCRVAEHSITLRIEHKPMQVDRAAVPVGQHPIPMRVAVAIGTIISKRLKRALATREVFERDRQIEIGMIARLAAK